MIITLLAWLYITTLCWMWGTMLLAYFKKISRQEGTIHIHFCITCLTGLAGITVFSSFLSLFIALNGLPVQLLIIFPCISLFFLKPPFPILKNHLSGIHIVFVLLLCICALLLLLMSTWSVTNEDTLAYHAQIIQWIEKYKAVPGIAHLHTRYGLQSSWFVSCALFGFRFLGINALTFLNSTVILWYFIFIISELNRNYYDKKNRLYAFGWLGIFLFSLWSYAQVRLAATSASPDFITILYSWLAFYLLLSRTNKEYPAYIYSLLLVTGVFTVTLKFSAAPIIILSLYGAYKLAAMRKFRTLLLSTLLSIATLVPFIARNIIASGYPAFPSIFPDVANVDWKLNKEINVYIKKYITTYARIKKEPDPENIDKANSMSITEWLPIWWENQSLADKSLILLLILSVCLLVIRVRQGFHSDGRLKIALITALAGIIFWFIQAPDPRFGFGFIIALAAVTLLFYTQAGNKLYNGSWKKAFVITSFATVVILTGYTGYRAINFFSPSQLLLPAGLKLIKYKAVICNGISLNIPEMNYSCGNTEVPCAYDSCRTFEARGKDVTEGFRAK
jgi:hypothetical protein